MRKHYDFSKADVVVSLDSDFLATDGNNLVNARGWAATRQKPVPGKKLSRLYVAESTYSTTGTAADHRFRTKSGDIAAVTFALANALGVGKGQALGQAVEKHPAAPFTKDGKPWVEVLARDLQSARGRSIAIVTRRSSSKRSSRAPRVRSP